MFAIAVVEGLMEKFVTFPIAFIWTACFIEFEILRRFPEINAVIVDGSQYPLNWLPSFDIWSTKLFEALGPLVLVAFCYLSERAQADEHSQWSKIALVYKRISIASVLLMPPLITYKEASYEINSMDLLALALFWLFIPLAYIAAIAGWAFICRCNGDFAMNLLLYFSPFCALAVMIVAVLISPMAILSSISVLLYLIVIFNWKSFYECAVEIWTELRERGTEPEARYASETPNDDETTIPITTQGDSTV